jgi:hypothetical protein
MRRVCPRLGGISRHGHGSAPGVGGSSPLQPGLLLLIRDTGSTADSSDSRTSTTQPTGAAICRVVLATSRRHQLRIWRLGVRIPRGAPPKPQLSCPVGECCLMSGRRTATKLRPCWRALPRGLRPPATNYGDAGRWLASAWQRWQANGYGYCAYCSACFRRGRTRANGNHGRRARPPAGPRRGRRLPGPDGRLGVTEFAPTGGPTSPWLGSLSGSRS